MEQDLIARVLGGGASVIALLLLIIYIGRKGEIWVWRRELDALVAEREKDELACAARMAELVKERDEWKKLALGSTNLMERAGKNLGDSQ